MKILKATAVGQAESHLDCPGSESPDLAKDTSGIPSTPEQRISGSKIKLSGLNQLHTFSLLLIISLNH